MYTHTYKFASLCVHLFIFIYAVIIIFVTKCDKNESNIIDVIKKASHDKVIIQILLKIVVHCMNSVFLISLY